VRKLFVLTRRTTLSCFCHLLEDLAESALRTDANPGCADLVLNVA
jgi:hypothetical protein